MTAAGSGPGSGRTAAGDGGAAGVVAARALGGSVLVAGGVLTLLGWWLVPTRALAVLARDDVFSVLWPLTPVLLATLVPSAVAFDRRDLERSAGRSAVSLRARCLGLVVAVAGVVTVASPHDTVIGARSMGVFLGLVLVSLAVLPGAAAWVPVALYVPSCWLLGTRRDGIHAPWAVPLRPADDAVAMRVAVALAVVGGVAFLVFGTRPDRGA